MSAHGLPWRSGELHQLAPGEWVIGEAPGQIETLLGSCVSLTAWHPIMRIGAASHCLLPQRPAGTRGSDPRFVDDAIDLMLRALRLRGADPRLCQLQLHGGGRMFETLGVDIGERNIAAAEEVLAERGLTLTARDTGGTMHRRIRLDLMSGEVQQRITGGASLPGLLTPSAVRSRAHG